MGYVSSQGGCFSDTPGLFSDTPAFSLQYHMHSNWVRVSRQIPSIRSEMADSSSIVALQVTILDNTIVDIDDVPWNQGMNGKDVLEAAYKTKADADFLFSLAYYGVGPGGEPLGYLVEEIEQIGDQPQLYWAFRVNGTLMDCGIDQVTLNAGDVVSFTYSYCDDQQTESTQLATKHRRFTGRR